MKLLKYTIVVILLLMAYSSTITADETTAEDKQITAIEKALTATVKVTEGDASGTGFYVRDDIIITNNHVVSKTNLNESVKVTYSDDTVTYATVIYKDVLGDISLLSTSTKRTPLVIAESVRVGQDVYAIGNPSIYSFSVSKGIVSKLWNYKYGVQFDAKMNFGSSGGVLINSSGQVVGMVSALDLDEYGIGFAVSGKDISLAVSHTVKTTKGAL